MQLQAPGSGNRCKGQLGGCGPHQWLGGLVAAWWRLTGSRTPSAHSHLSPKPDQCPEPSAVQPGFTPASPVMVPPTDKQTPNPEYISYPSGAGRVSDQSCRRTAPGSGVLTCCPKGQGWAPTPGVQAGGGLTLMCGHEVPHPHPWVWQGAGASGLQPALGSPCTSSRVSSRDFPLTLGG